MLIRDFLKVGFQHCREKMKIVILLFTFMVLLNFASTSQGFAVRNRNNYRRNQDVDIPLRSQIYVQTPGDRVFIGRFQFLSYYLLPPWIEPPYIAEDNSERVYVRMVDGIGLTGNLAPLQNYPHMDHVRGYRCYIQTPNNTLLTAVLRPNDNVIYSHQYPRVFVRIPGEPNKIYSGVLEAWHTVRPPWLPRFNI